MMDASVRLLLGIAATGALVVALWLLAVSPKREQASSLGDQVAQAQQTRDDALASAAIADQARAGYPRAYATVARLGKAVPPNADVPSLVYQLSAAAHRAKVDFRAVDVLDSVPSAPATPAAAGAGGGGIKPTPFSFTFQGSYFGLQKLLAEVDRYSRVKGTQVLVDGRLLTIDGVSITPAPHGLPRVQGLVTARAYVASVPDALPGTTAAATVTPASRVTTP
jgi:Tfp pilus assembly protein PilO